MAVFSTILGVLLIIVAIPFGLMAAPLMLGVLLVFLGWRHVSSALEAPTGSEAAAAS